VRQHAVRRAPRPAPRRRFALQLIVRRDARCVGPTSAISRLRTSTRASSVLDASGACAAARSRRSPVSHQSDSLRRAARSLSGSQRGGRCLPTAMRACLASDTPVASSTTAHCARANVPLWKPPRPPPRARVNEAYWLTIRGAFHRSRTIAPQRSFERPAPVFADTAALPPRCWLSMPFHPPGAFRIRVGRAPVHAARCQRDSRFSGPRRRSPTSATETTRGHTLRAFDPRTRVRLSPRCSPAPTDAGCVGLVMRCRIGSLRATTCTRRLAHAAFHLRGQGRSWTGALE